ncbi:MAG: restriction endonuclease subunit S, partial [Candidatus Limiplasma sp.]|nr:restriction endonuclease subunit S [Candidatus Limiplasma sp.]
MRCEGWRSSRIVDMVSFSPRETLPKNKLAKKVAMEKLSPFQKAIDGFELNNFNGGTKFRNGDTLLARITPCLENGKTAKVSILEEGEVGFGSSEYIVMRNKPGITDADFVYYLATSPAFRELAIKSMVGTSGRQRVQQDLIESAVMSFPPLPEQRAIAATLSCLDDKIELNNRMNKTLEEMAQAIFKSWFVDFEPFQDGEFVDSELGRIPKGWRVGVLDECIELYDYKRIPLSSRERASMDKLYPYYGATSLMDYVNDFIFDGVYVLLGEDGSVVDSEGYPILQYVWGKFWVNNHAHILKGRNGYDEQSIY